MMKYCGSVESQMKVGSTVNFPGDLGKHSDLQGQDCPGRLFEPRQVGIGGVYINRVECKVCHRELPAWEGRLGADSPDDTTAA